MIVVCFSTIGEKTEIREEGCVVGASWKNTYAGA